ncbi:MAG: SecD/SecF family protein translocase subunit [Oscillospiraceae bacterium]|nr:SecD/SecF family protein translocase subunit [Oscillospiraceae bacterium]
MRRVKKPVFFIVVVLIAVFAFLTFNGVSTYYGDTKTSHIKGVDEIRWGIDISGGVDVTFSPPEGVEATQEQMDGAQAAIEMRLVSLGITDYELYADYSNYDIIVRFPWQAGEEDFDPEAAVAELGETAQLTFREGYEVDDLGLPTGVTAENIILTGENVELASAAFRQNENGEYEFLVALEFDSEGTSAFADATTRLSAEDGVISIWMDDTCISAPTVGVAITDGKCEISGDFTQEEAKALADKISAGALPYELVTSNFSTISATMGAGARNAMLIAGAIAFALICVYMIVVYRLPGVVASIALAGQVVGTIACITGFFGFMPSFTLTIPGIAGIILAVGMGVDANVVTFERVKEELRAGKGLYTSLELGYSRAWAAIFDGNITIVFVAVILMGAFGPPDSLFAKAMSWLYFMFPTTIEGTIYSFGYTLLVGVVLNFVFGVFCTRIMLASLAKFKALRNPKLYGGVSDEQ